MYYKVWIQIEQIDDDNDTYENVEEPLEIGVYDTLEEAIEIQTAIHKQHWTACNGPECSDVD